MKLVVQRGRLSMSSQPARMLARNIRMSRYEISILCNVSKDAEKKENVKVCSLDIDKSSPSGERVYLIYSSMLANGKVSL